MVESRDGILTADRKAWGYNQAFRGNGRDTLIPKELARCTNPNHKQGLVLLTFFRDNILEALDLRADD